MTQHLGRETILRLWNGCSNTKLGWLGGLRALVVHSLSLTGRRLPLLRKAFGLALTLLVHYLLLRTCRVLCQRGTAQGVQASSE